MASLLLQIPKRAHTSIIGAGGSNVRRIQDELKVSVNIPRREDPSNEVIVSGPSADAVSKAKAEIEKSVGYLVFEEPLYTIVLDVPATRHAAIIGKGGSVINGLKKEFNTEVQTPPKETPGTHVTLQGPLKGVVACRRRIEELVGDKIAVVSDTTAGAAGTAAGAAAPVAAFKKLSLDGDIAESLFFENEDKEGNAASFERFIAYLQSTTKSIDVCVFTLTDDRIVRILQSLKAHGATVRIITDNDTAGAEGSDVDRLKAIGVPVKKDLTAAHMHHKFAIIDQKVLVSGSYNWTRGASDANYENIMVTSHKKFVADFQKEFDSVWAKLP